MLILEQTNKLFEIMWLTCINMNFSFKTCLRMHIYGVYYNIMLQNYDYIIIGLTQDFFYFKSLQNKPKLYVNFYILVKLKCFFKFIRTVQK